MAVSENKGRPNSAAPAFWLVMLLTRAVKSFLALCFTMFPVCANAEILTFETDETVLIVRGQDMFGTAVFEFIGDLDTMYQCVALDSSGSPIAVTLASASVGKILYTNLDVTTVDAIKCRKV